MKPLGARPAPCSPRHADPVPPRRDEIVQLDGATKRALETGRARLLVGAALFALAFAAICGRLVDVTMLEDGIDPRTAEQPGLSAPVAERADIVDRNGVVLATSLATGSLFANPRQITNVDEAAKELAATIPDLSVAELKAKLGADKSFVWLQRDMTPQQQFAVNRLGIMGLYFQADERRVYPMGSLTAHVVGFTDVDAKGLAGIERSFDDVLAGGRHPVQLSLDVRIQQIMREELQRGIDDFNGIGGAGIVLDAQTGEILSLVSLPDFDPNLAATAGPDQRFNRATLGVYEMGSTFKTLNTAMALDSGKIKMTDTFDAAHNIQIGRFTIHDFEHMNRALSVPEVFMYSSNIGAARMAMVVGIDIQKAFMAKFGMLRPVSLELPELRQAAVPRGLAAHQQHDHRLRSGHRRQRGACRLRRGRDGQWRADPARDADQALARRGERTASASFRPIPPTRCVSYCVSSSRPAPANRPMRRAISSAARPARRRSRKGAATKRMRALPPSSAPSP